MDLQMPIMDGYQSTIYIRNILKMDIPIIAMTVHSLVGEQQKCLDIGMNAYVPKPFKQAELLDKIHLVLAIKSDTETTRPLFTESIPMKIKEKKTIDLSYLDEMMGEDRKLKKEIIDLFIENIPTDVDLLGKAIVDKNVLDIKQIAHRIKPSFSMFNLRNEVAFLEQTEGNANASVISAGIVAEFDLFKRELAETIEVLQEM